MLETIYSPVNSPRNESDRPRYDSNESFTDPRRGMLESKFKNDKIEFSIQQKRCLEYRLEKEKMDRQDLLEDYQVLMHEFAKYREIVQEKQTALNKEIANLQERLATSCEELIKTKVELETLQRVIEAQEARSIQQAEIASKNEDMCRARLVKLEEQDDRFRRLVAKWLKSSQNLHARVGQQYEELIERIVSLAYQSYSGAADELRPFATTTAGCSAVTPGSSCSRPVALAHKAVPRSASSLLGRGCKENAPSISRTDDPMMQIMSNAVLLPPYGRRHKPSAHHKITDSSNMEARGRSHSNVNASHQQSSSKTVLLSRTASEETLSSGPFPSDCRKSFTRMPFGRKDPQRMRSNRT